MNKPYNGKQLLTLLSLVILSLLFAMAGCSKGNKKAKVPGEEWAEDLRARIEKHIIDSDKKHRLMNLVVQEVKLFKELIQVTELYTKKLIVVDKDYHATPEDFKTLLSEYNVERYRLRAQALEIRFKMKALCSPEEWQDLSHFKTKKGLFKQLPQAPGSN